MADSDSSIQRITRLTPLGTILGLIEARVGAVEPSRRPLAQGFGCTLAEDVVAPPLPPMPIALRDGFAVAAAAVADASSYAPVPLAAMPPRVDVGEALPGGTDAVLPLDAVMLRGGRAEAIAAVTPGDGVLPAGGDAAIATPLRRAGQRLRAVDVALMEAVGMSHVMIRAPRICLACGSAARTAPIEGALAFLARAGAAAGAEMRDRFSEPGRIDAALTDANADAVIAIGGTGSGRNDASVATLARLGRVEAHGIAIAPGETAAFGFVDTRPVLLVPGRLDATLAAWLLIGRPLVAKLAGGRVEESLVMLPLQRKVTSTIGLTELIPVRCADGMAEPLGAAYLSVTALARSDGWIVVPADSEGFQAGTQVAVQRWM